MEGDIKQASLGYLDRGWSVIQIGTDKKPIFKWQEFQNRRASKQEVEEWFQKNPSGNVGIVTGKISGITVVDVEAGGDISKWPETFTVRTGGGGYHMYYLYQEGIRNGARICELTDIRGEGGYVVAPPSMHSSGNRYLVFKDIPMVPFPMDVFNLVKPTQSNSSHHDFSGFLNGVESGSRNDAAAKVAGMILKFVNSDDLMTTGWQLMVAWNQSNNPPLDEKELRSVFTSIAKRETTKRDSEKKNSIVSDDDSRIVHISEAVTNKDGNYSTPYPTGFEVFDEVMKGGVRGGDLTVVTGMSGEGKTTFSQNITVRMAESGVSTLWFSYELTIDNIYAKFKEMGIDPETLQIYTPKRAATGNIEWIIDRIKAGIAERKVKAVFIDHLDFITPKRTNSNEQRRIMLRDICQELKSVALELDVSIFLMAHVKKVQGREIEMQDIAESSGIYQLADYVFTVKRDTREVVDNSGKVFYEYLDTSRVRILKNRLTGKQAHLDFKLINSRVCNIWENSVLKSVVNDVVEKEQEIKKDPVQEVLDMF